MILDFLFPTQCLVCKKYGDYLCFKCLKKLKTTLPNCPICRHISPHYTYHRSCLKKDINDIKSVRTLWEYDKYSKLLLLNYKYKGYEKLGKYLAELASSRLRIDSKDKILIPIPSYFIKTNNRGYDHIKILTKYLSRKTGILYSDKILEKYRNTKPQVGLSYAQRSTNIEGVFRIHRHNIAMDKREFILIDDVFTTGSTLKEASKTIKRYNPDIQISAICLFQGANKEKMIK